jgi:hypothetical protein
MHKALCCELDLRYFFSHQMHKLVTVEKWEGCVGLCQGAQTKIGVMV